MASEFVDPRMTSIKPRIRYNTIGGINGPLVVLDNVRFYELRIDRPIINRFNLMIISNKGVDRSNSPGTMKSSP